MTFAIESNKSGREYDARFDAFVERGEGTQFDTYDEAKAVYDALARQGMNWLEIVEEAHEGAALVRRAA